MRRTRYVVLGLVLGLLVGGAGLSWAQGAGRTHEARPFEGTSSGASQVVLPPTGPLLLSETAGTFWALHLGRGTYEGTLAQDYVRHPDPQCAFVSGDLVLTAANGDELHLRTGAPGAPGNPLAEGRSVVCAPADQGPGGAEPGDLYRSTLYFDVVGGTGRFADASGWVFSRGGSTVGDEPGATTDQAVMLGDIDY